MTRQPLRLRDVRESTILPDCGLYRDRPAVADRGSWHRDYHTWPMVFFNLYSLAGAGGSAQVDGDGAQAGQGAA